MSLVGLWAEQALCIGQMDLFYPAEHDHTRSHRLAIAICETCPVIDECRDHALITGETFGVWGGLSPKQLRIRRNELGIYIAPTRNAPTQNT